MTAAYSISSPESNEVPILLSVPHCGTSIPQELIHEFDEEHLNQLDDTDFYVDKLYDFAPAMGITVISSVFHRWVIDLNRDPESRPLYADGRIITSLCPTTDFNGQPIYVDKRTEISKTETESRKQEYFWPYHNKLQELLDGLLQKFGKVLLWDCHSIRHHVKGIHPDPFPDLVLGTADDKSASKNIIDAAIKSLSTTDYSFSHNYPFKGGYITRHYGNPETNRHAIQLEMSKLVYMDNNELVYDETRADELRKLLMQTLGKMIKLL
jgi:N-formylglutamate deformylase